MDHTPSGIEFADIPIVLIIKVNRDTMIAKIRHQITAIELLILGLFCGFPVGQALAEVTPPEHQKGHALQVRLAHASSFERYAAEEMNPALQDEILQEIRLYRALDSIIQQLKIDLQVEGEEPQAGILFEIPAEMAKPAETEQLQLQLEFEVHSDTLP